MNFSHFDNYIAQYIHKHTHIYINIFSFKWDVLTCVLCFTHCLKHLQKWTNATTLSACAVVWAEFVVACQCPQMGSSGHWSPGQSTQPGIFLHTHVAATQLYICTFRPSRCCSPCWAGAVSERRKARLI